MKTKKIRINYIYKVGSTVTIEVPANLTTDQIENAIHEGGIFGNTIEDIADERKETVECEIDATNCPDNSIPDWSCTSNDADSEEMEDALIEAELILSNRL